MTTSQTQQNDSAAPELEREPNLERGRRFYDGFYGRGGWKQPPGEHRRWLRRNLVKRFGLRRGARILEVGCGMGLHTHLLTRMGFRCVGVDQSPVGIEHARHAYPKSTYHCCNALGDMPVERGSFDVVFARGFSSYHYDLHTEAALRATAHLLKYLKPGGLFVMTITTDLSGKREPGRIWHNRLEDYGSHFASFGGRWSVDYDRDMVICGLWAHAEEPEPAAAEPPNGALAFCS